MKMRTHYAHRVLKMKIQTHFVFTTFALLQSYCVIGAKNKKVACDGLISCFARN
jgi:hypothetical protein